MVSPPVAQLRQLISDCFDQEELRTLCVDLDVDYDSLIGDAKVARVRALIEYFARRNRLALLVEYCAAQRTAQDWSNHLATVKNQPDQFLPDAIEPVEPTPKTADPTGTSSGNIVLNANQALKMGFAAGIIVVSLFGCGLVSGLLASRVISLNPVQPSQQALRDGLVKIQVLRSQASIIPIAPDSPSGEPATPPVIDPSALSTIKMASDEATSLADAILKRLGSPAPVREMHVRFEQDQAVVTFRQAASNRQMAVAYTVQAQRGRLTLTAQSAWVHLLEIRGSTIGWFPIPVSWASETTTWFQQSINLLTNDFYFTRVDTRRDELTITGVRTTRR